MTPVEIAKIAHETNRAYCQTLGDNSQLAWEEAPAWQRDSAIKGVKFHLANPGSPPSASHNEWLKLKAADGWTFGPVKDVEKKQHPCFVSYDQLPIDQQIKDALFIAVIEALKPLTGPHPPIDRPMVDVIANALV